MKAAVIKSVGEIGIETMPDPTPSPGEVIVEVAACGLCGTDLHILQGEFAPTLPIVPGHEFSGTVVAQAGVTLGVGADLTGRALVTNGPVTMAGSNLVGGCSAAIPCPPITVHPATLAMGTVGIGGSQQLTATGGTAPYTFAITGGALPPGLMLSPSGLISGTATVSGSFSFTVRATAQDPGGNTGAAEITVSVGPAPVVIQPQFSPLRAVVGSDSEPVSGGVNVGGGDVLRLSVDYLNYAQAQAAVLYVWSVQTEGGAWTDLSGELGDGATTSVRAWTVPVHNSSSGVKYTVRVQMFGADQTLIGTRTLEVSVQAVIG